MVARWGGGFVVVVTLSWFWLRFGFGGCGWPCLFLGLGLVLDLICGGCLLIGGWFAYDLLVAVWC